jgi:L-fuconolactonase
MARVMRVDAHQHFWRVARGDYGWLTPKDHPAIARDFLPKDLGPLLKYARVDRTVLVQAAPTIAETRFLLDLAENTPFVAGVVGWIDFQAQDAAASIARLAESGKLVGLRPMIQDIADDRWMLSAKLAPALLAMEEMNLVFDALVKPRHLPVLGEFLARHPGLRVVIDHGAKPNIASGNLTSWRSGMREIARNSRACCKLSGLVTEAGRSWSVASLQPCVDVLFEAFGADRLMWGSDWPVLNEASDYLSWMRAAEVLTEPLSPRERDAAFGGTAAAFYGFK